MPLFCELSSLITESDVEQKLIFPFLTAEEPIGLGIDSSQIMTKAVLRQRCIGKGQKQKYYFPDYIVVIRGIPTLVLEAKKPDEDLENAYSEARLYAEEINAGFPHNVNVCQKIVVCNGNEIWAGYSDQAEPEIKLTFDDLNLESVGYSNLKAFCAKKDLENYANKPYVKSRGKSEFKTPVSQLGGKRVQNEELEENSFGRTFVFEYRNIFDPESEEDRNTIVENAYVPSAKREQHMEPMYKEIRKFELPSKKNSTSLATSEPSELAQRISQRLYDKVDAYSLMLLIGNVGSGKTTFVRYFRKMFLEKSHPDLAKRCDWVFLNMNNAPLTKEEIYTWLRINITETIKTNHNDIDFSNLETIKRLFRKDLEQFELGIGKLLEGDKQAYNQEVYKLLNNRLSDSSLYLDALLNFLKNDYGMLPIIVLDNCDKRTKDEQLLMFEVAQWLRTTFSCIVILPMRDTTYDVYRYEPPLDTVVKDLVFRIDPPDLFKVIQARLDYIIRITNQTDSSYVLQNGMKVSVKKMELIEYFRCILLSIRNNRMISDIFYRLSDRNTRSGIEIFEGFCKSGHISADDILKVRVSDEDVPTYKFLNALLRKNRRYYNGDESNFINLFYSDYNDDFPDPFVRVDILNWLLQNNKKEGPTKNKGMFPARDIVRDMQLIGHEESIIQREINRLFKKGLIFSEAVVDSISKDDLIKITITGKLHMNMLNNVIYLAACAENVLFKNTGVMIQISRRLSYSSYLSKLAMTLTANELVEYLDEYRTDYYSHSDVYLEEAEEKHVYDLGECKNAISKWLDTDSGLKAEFEKIQQYKVGTQVMGTVVKKEHKGMVCLFGEEEIKGFLSVLDKKYNMEYKDYTQISVDDKLVCEIFEYDYDHNSFQLKFIKILDSEKEENED